MLTWSFILQRIKEELSLPFQVLEKSDEEIIDYCKRNSLKTFEQYFPDKNRITLNCADDRIKVPGRVSEFYIIEPDEREILGVIDFIPTMGPLLMNNHPWLGPFSYGEIENWALKTYQAGLLNQFSNFKYNYEFIPPNQLRISPQFNGNCVVEIERSHDLELSTIPPTIQNTFVNLCIGQFLMMIGRIRKKYSSYSTPFGNIELSGDDLFNDGKEIYDRTIDEMKMGSLPNVVFHSG